MKPIPRRVAIAVGLVLLLNITPSWGGPPNPTASDANQNTAGGSFALVNVVTSGSPQGSGNTAFGDGALEGNTTGSFNTAFGSTALTTNTTSGFNTAIGTNALFTNTAIGNTALGYNALMSNTSGERNTASGTSALETNSTGTDNTASGDSALDGNTMGSFNTASGSSALSSNITGSDNTASGAQALGGNTTGNANTAVGFNALLGNIGGAKNTAVGVNALKKSTGNKNIAIGFQAGANLATGGGNIYLGNPGDISGSESQTIRIGAAQTRTFIAGIATTGVSGATVEIDANGQLGISLSSARYKRDIARMDTRSEKLLQLRPVTFAYKDDAQGLTHYGLIAEEVAAVYPELATHTPTGEVQTVRYQELIPMLLNELQRQQQELAELRALVEQRRGAEAEPAPSSRFVRPSP